jgi:hypothetical protein
VAASEAAKRSDEIAAIPGEWVRAQISYMQEGPDYDEPWTAESGFPWSDDSDAPIGKTNSTKGKAV